MEHPGSEAGHLPLPTHPEPRIAVPNATTKSPSVDPGLKLLEVLDDMGGRFLDNADFLAVPDPGSFFR